MKTLSMLLAGLAAAVLLGACATPPPAPAPAPKLTLEDKVKRMRENWTPGGTAFVVAETLTMFPCHDEELPCGQMEPPPVERVQFKAPIAGNAAKGEAIATNIRYGNCIACHSLPNGHQGGSIGPSLSDYAVRNLQPDYTFQRIWDVRALNPNAFMPVYGPNAALTEQEIRDVMAFLYAQR